MRKAIPAAIGLFGAVTLIYLFATRANPHRDILGTETKIFSQFDEELIIRDFFQDRRNGFYVDVGCAHPDKGSTTHYLDSRLGWTGIGIDALKEFGPSWRKLRPRSKFFNFLVTDHSGTEDAFYRSARVSSVSRGIASRLLVPEGQPLRRVEKLKVPSITLNDLLEREGVHSIDFLSMDIEGHEPEALEGFDIGRYKPELVCIEYRLNEKKILEYFTSNGYQRIKHSAYDPANW
jgi:FkbM family methyltransferase